VPDLFRSRQAEKKATDAQQRYDAAVIDRAIQDAALANGVLPEASRTPSSALASSAGS
jgi:hypothetical protein